MKNPGTMRMETKQLMLRLFVTEDASAMFRNWTNDSQAAEFLSWEPHKDVGETKKILEGWIVSYESKGFYTWAVAWREDEGNIIGSIAVPQFNQKVGRAAIRHCLGRKQWGNGIMREALVELIRSFFEVKDINRVEALHDTHDVNSRKVMMVCGFRKGKTSRQYG